MAQVSKYLRRVGGGYAHWCPGCGETHVIFDRWAFDGNVDKPTFNPSVKITGKQCVIVDGEWTGEWVRDANGNAVDMCCHYFLHAGQIEFCGDCTHSLSGKTVPLPELKPAPGGSGQSQKQEK